MLRPRRLRDRPGPHRARPISPPDRQGPVRRPRTTRRSLACPRTCWRPGPSAGPRLRARPARRPRRQAGNAGGARRSRTAPGRPVEIAVSVCWRMRRRIDARPGLPFEPRGIDHNHLVADDLRTAPCAAVARVRPGRCGAESAARLWVRRLNGSAGSGAFGPADDGDGGGGGRGRRIRRLRRPGQAPVISGHVVQLRLTHRATDRSARAALAAGPRISCRGKLHAQPVTDRPGGSASWAQQHGHDRSAPSVVGRRRRRRQAHARGRQVAVGCRAPAQRGAELPARSHGTGWPIRPRARSNGRPPACPSAMAPCRRGA